MDASTGVLIWWAGLSAVSLFNFGAWILAAQALGRRRGAYDAEAYATRRKLLGLAAIYVAVCAFRSFLPRADVQRIVLVDHWLSTVMVGRSVATVAELAFVAQWALLLREFGKEAGVRITTVISRVVVPLICIAEISSWYAVVSTNYLGNAIEQSIWTFTGFLAAVGCVAIWSRSPKTYRPILAACIVSALGFVFFMSTVDVPMYVSRLLADHASGRAFLSLNEGLRDVATRRVVTYRWEDWSEELAWMACYFSVAVWMSIAFALAPRFKRA